MKLTPSWEPWLLLSQCFHLRSVNRRAASASTPSLSSSVLIRCRAKMILLLSEQNVCVGENLGKVHTYGDIPADLNYSLPLVMPHVQLPGDVPKHVLRVAKLSCLFSPQMLCYSNLNRTICVCRSRWRSPLLPATSPSPSSSPPPPSPASPSPILPIPAHF